MKGINYKLCILITAMAMNQNMHAQTDWKSKYPDADAVYTRLSCDVNIKMEDGKLVATSENSEDLVFLTDNSVKMMNRGYIYHSSFNELKKWDAYTQLPEEKKKLKVSNANTTSSRQDYIFYDDVKSTAFDYTGVTVGATRHLEYQIQHNDVFLLSPHYFERYFPVAEGDLRISFPSNIKLKYIIKGLNASKVTFSESKKRDRITYTFHVSNLDGVRSYADAPDNAYYATHIIYYIEQQEQGGQWKNFLATTDDLYQHSYDYIKNVNQSLDPEVKRIADSLTAHISNDLDKAKLIYRWVQSNIKYVAFEQGMEGFVPREANLVCNRRFGDCKDMASILTAMLNYVKIPAYFTWIGTREIPYDYTEVPLPIVDNHMICAIRNGSDFIFLDGTDDGCMFGTPPIGIQGKQAMIGISDKEYKIVRVPVTPKENNILTDSTFMELTDKGIVGKIKVKMKGYYATSLHSILGYKNEKEKEDYFKNRFGRGSNKIRFSNWKAELKEDHSEATITADFELPDYAKKLGDEWFLNMNLFKSYEHEEIDYPKRKIPIQYQFLKQSTYVTSIKMPAGFKTSYIPKSDTFQNNVWGFKMNYSTDKDHVYMSQSFDTDQLLLYPDQFEAWNKVLEHLFPNYKQTISISKN